MSDIRKECLTSEIPYSKLLRTVLVKRDNLYCFRRFVVSYLSAKARFPTPGISKTLFLRVAVSGRCYKPHWDGYGGQTGKREIFRSLKNNSRIFCKHMAESSELSSLNSSHVSSHNKTTRLKNVTKTLSDHAVPTEPFESCFKKWNFSYLR